MVDNVDGTGHFPSILRWCNSVKFIVLLPKYPYIDEECRGKGNDFHIVTVRPPVSHCLEIALECGLHVISSRCRYIQWSRKGSSSLAFGVSTLSSSRMDNNKGFEVFGIGGHILDDSLTKLDVLGLVSVHLIRESVEEAVSYVIGLVN